MVKHFCDRCGDEVKIEKKLGIIQQRGIIGGEGEFHQHIKAPIRGATASILITIKASKKITSEGLEEKLADLCPQCLEDIINFIVELPAKPAPPEKDRT